MQPFHESNVGSWGHQGAVPRFTPPCPRKRHGTSPVPLMPLNRCGLVEMKNPVLQLVASFVQWRIPFQQDDIPMLGTRRPHRRGCASEFTRHWWLFMERDAWRVGQARGAFPRHGGRCPNRRLWDSGQRDALVLCKPRTACFHGQIQGSKCSKTVQNSPSKKKNCLKNVPPKMFSAENLFWPKHFSTEHVFGKKKYMSAETCSIDKFFGRNKFRPKKKSTSVSPKAEAKGGTRPLPPNLKNG